MRYLVLLAGAFLLSTAHAQLGKEIAEKYAARVGDRLAALTAFRAEGRISVNGSEESFVLVAQRPDRLRVESFTPLGRAVQGYDGLNPPWISHTEVNVTVTRSMAEAQARDFIADADFDGPLVDFARKNYSVDYAGEDAVNGHRAFKLLVMDKRDDISFLWVDAVTYDVVKRTAYRDFDGRRVAVDTFFKDFRVVGGVPLPCKIETTANGRTVYVMTIDRIEANPGPIPPETFTRPVGN